MPTAQFTSRVRGGKSLAWVPRFNLPPGLLCAISSTKAFLAMRLKRPWAASLKKAQPHKQAYLYIQRLRSPTHHHPLARTYLWEYVRVMSLPTYPRSPSKLTKGLGKHLGMCAEHDVPFNSHSEPQKFLLIRVWKATEQLSHLFSENAEAVR